MSKPITMIVPGAPGGAVDSGAPVFAQQFAVHIGTALVAKAANDGYTLLMIEAARLQG